MLTWHESCTSIVRIWRLSSPECGATGISAVDGCDLVLLHYDNRAYHHLVPAPLCEFRVQSAHPPIRADWRTPTQEVSHGHRAFHRSLP